MNKDNQWSEESLRNKGFVSDGNGGWMPGEPSVPAKESSRLARVPEIVPFKNDYTPPNDYTAVLPVSVTEATQEIKRLFTSHLTDLFWEDVKKSYQPYKFNIQPFPKPRMTVGDRANFNPRIRKYWAFKEELLRQAKDRNFYMNDILIVEFNIAMPPSWSKKKKLSMLNRPHKQTPDTDNLVKALKDCLCNEDKTIYEEYSRKYWSTYPSIIIYQ